MWLSSACAVWPCRGSCDAAVLCKWCEVKAGMLKSKLMQLMPLPCHKGLEGCEACLPRYASKSVDTGRRTGWKLIH